MNCPYCKHSIDSERRICPNCRAILEATDVKEKPKHEETLVPPKKDRKELASIIFGLLGVYFALVAIIDYENFIVDNLEMFQMNKVGFAIGLSLWQILFASLCVRYSILANKIRKNNTHRITLIMASATYIITIIHFILIITYSA